MPQAVNIVIKNGASTPVDKTFTLISPAAGFQGIALWQLKEGDFQVGFPSITLQVVDVPRGQRRRARVRLRLPVTMTQAATPGAPEELANLAEFHGEVILPYGFPESKKDDFIAFAGNMMKNALVAACLRDAEPAV